MLTKTASRDRREAEGTFDKHAMLTSALPSTLESLLITTNSGRLNDSDNGVTKLLSSRILNRDSFEVTLSERRNLVAVVSEDGSTEARDVDAVFVVSHSVGLVNERLDCIYSVVVIFNLSATNADNS
jgi:hypothetical protein